MFLKRKPSKARRGLSPTIASVHRNGPETPWVLQFSSFSFVSNSPVHQAPEASSFTSVRGSVLDLMGARGWASSGSCVGARLHSFSTRRARLHPSKHVHTVSHTHPLAPRWNDSDIPLGNNVFSRSSWLWCVAVYKYQHAEHFSCIAKEHFLILQWDTACYLAVGCFVWVDFAVAPKASYKVPQNSKTIAIPPQC